MKISILIFIFMLGLSGCSSDDEKKFVFWDEQLDVYMTEYGYRISEDRSKVYRNNILLYTKTSDCYLSCISYHGPDDMETDVQKSIRKAIETSDIEFNRSMMQQLKSEQKGTRNESDP